MMNKMSTKLDWLFSGLFLLFIILPLLGFLFTGDKKLSLDEKRELAQKPSWPADLAGVIPFTGEFESYFNDQFGFRNDLLLLNSALRYYLLNASSNSRVLVGRDRWLYLEDAVNDYRNDPLLTTDEIRRLVSAIHDRHNWLRARQVAYLFVIAPNKHTIYPEHLPARVDRLGSTSRMDQLLGAIRQWTDIPVLDLRPALTRAKAERPVYHQIGTHWNDFGAGVAAREIAAQLARQSPDITPRRLSHTDFTWEVSTADDDDLAKMIGLSGRLRQPTPTLAADLCYRRISFNLKDYPPKTKIGGCPEERLRALMFGDSFLDPLVPYLSQHFRELTIIRGRLDQRTLVHFTRKIRPDIVIDEWVERAILDEVPGRQER